MQCSSALSGPDALSVRARRSLALFVGPRRSVCQAPALSVSGPGALCVGAQRSLSPGALCRAPALSVSGPTNLSPSVSRLGALSLVSSVSGPGALSLSVGARCFLCRAPALLMSKPRHPLALCVRICVGPQRSSTPLCVGASARCVGGPSLAQEPALCRLCCVGPQRSPGALLSGPAFFGWLCSHERLQEAWKGIHPHHAISHLRVVLMRPIEEAFWELLCDLERGLRG